MPVRAIATGLLSLTLAGLIGCSSVSPGRRQSAAELSDPDPQAAGVPSGTASNRNPNPPAEPQRAAAAPGSKSFVQRHPLLDRPVTYYRDAGENPWSKTAAAVVVGVPVGVAQEMWQIVRGK